VARVVLPHVVALEPLNGSRELFGRAFEDRVVVGVHEAVGVERQAEARHRGEEQDEEQAPVSVRAEEHGLVHRVCRDVEVAVRKIPTEDSGHAANGTDGGRLQRPT
jgi:hypothetical protein